LRVRWSEGLDGSLRHNNHMGLRQLIELKVPENTTALLDDL
jgi:hypothetical protein